MSSTRSHPETALGPIDYEELLASGDPHFAWRRPDDEWQALSLCYTSGTTGNPKGVVYHHRGAFLNALGNALVFRLSPNSVYLWTLPMFHCNGWTYTWAATAVGATHVCLRKMDPAVVFPLIRDAGVTHMCAAPIVLNMLIHAPDAMKVRFDHVVDVATGGAAPPSPVIAAMESMGFRVLHLYGLTEVYGPATWCPSQPEWRALPSTERAERDGAAGRALSDAAGDAGRRSDNPGSRARRQPHHWRGHAARSYGHAGLPEEPQRLRGGVPRRLVSYRRSGRASPGRLRRGQGPVEGHHHLGRREHFLARGRGGAVPPSGGDGGCRGGAPGRSLGRDALCLRSAQARRAGITGGESVAWCREHLAHFKVPRRVVFGPLPKTSTGKIQKFELREQAKALA